MKKKLNTVKKIAALGLTAALTTVMMCGTSYETEASIRASYYSNPWSGTQSSSIVVKDISPDRFLRVTYKNEEVNSSNYSVKEQDGGTVITFKQEYLQSLNLPCGEYFFNAVFKGRRALPLYGIVLEEGQNEVTLERNYNAVVSKIELSKPGFERENVDKSNYTVTTDEENLVFNFNEEYLQSITGNKAFIVHVIEDTIVNLVLIKGELGDVDNNGKISLDDAQSALKMALKIEGYNDIKRKLSDTDNDNQITLTDTQNILKKALRIQ